MGRELYQQAKQIVIAALDLPATQRERYLSEACGGDEDLVAEVRSLLAQLDTPSPLVEDGLVKVGRSLPDHIGPYQVLDVLGEGGMGLVYRGLQTEPIQREVAIKVLHAGLNTDRVLERFAWERRSLARMSHPNIARILDAGADENGRPYVVLELVDGTPVTTWCRENSASLTEILDLMGKICQAVQHAHDRGVLHRDLKPGNILVRTIDGEALPSIIDFGIAKALDETEAATGQAPLTLEGQQIGTPAYMSPEQLSGSTDLDVRTDVYALGVILYELLTASRPFDDEHLRNSRQRENPRLPSRVKGDRDLRGDLDNICLMAIRPEAERRYHSAAALSADLTRFTAGQPVLASPDSWRYRAGKTARRNPIQATVLGALFFFVLASVGFLGFHAKRLNTERDRALVAEDLAHQEAAAAEEIASFLEGLFSEMDPIEEGVAPASALELLDNGAIRLESELTDQPANRARLWSVIGRVNHSIARDEIAEDQLRRSLAAYAQVPDSAGTLAPRAEITYLLAICLHDLGRYDEAEVAFRGALTLHRAASPDPDVKRAQIVTDLATVIQAQGRLGEAQQELSRALDLAESLGEDGEGEVAYIRNIRGYILYKMGNYDEAMRDVEAALLVHRRLYPGDTMELVSSLNNVGGLSLELGDYERAGVLINESRDILLRIFQGKPHPAISRADGHLARLAMATGDTTTAIAGFERSHRLHFEQLGPDNPYTWNSMLGLAEARRAQGRTAEAGTLYRETLAVMEANLGPHDLKTLIGRQRYARFLLASGRPVAAQREAETLIDLYSANFTMDHPKLQSARVDLAEALLQQDDRDGALAALRVAVPALEKVYAPGHSECTRARALLAQVQ